ncbi:hypothetical protein NVP1261O_32 [Vibrio phage 1.261.O._10N.286.51.A7]|uniref:Uncharacterized protein n=1 Tax=Vibrio phage 1.261.O._10N.286.51.A7 TaxID=1881237 RepID=A0A2I7RZF8_9CAUD|nr:hypothetical protein HOU80_gp70 [Vibrio phage 1.261.O._10N.286.51.A7]AUR99036.1 hypothetical protein NVP1261O_32 [Vibrio phage 1.261.O._10N.286.51.A7]
MLVQSLVRPLTGRVYGSDGGGGDGETLYLLRCTFGGEVIHTPIVEEVAQVVSSFSSDNNNRATLNKPAGVLGVELEFMYERDSVEYLLSTITFLEGQTTGTFTPFNYAPQASDVLLVYVRMFDCSGFVGVTIEGKM